MEWLVPILTTIIGGAFGYLVAIRQGKDELAKLEVENARLKAERDETHFSHRQGNYHELLNASDTLSGIFGKGHSESYEESCQDELTKYVNGVSIFGTERVAVAARALHDEHMGGARPDTITQLRAELVTAMREDVAPDRPST